MWSRKEGGRIDNDDDVERGDIKVRKKERNSKIKIKDKNKKKKNTKQEAGGVTKELFPLLATLKTLRNIKGQDKHSCNTGRGWFTRPSLV